MTKEIEKTNQHLNQRFSVAVSKKVKGNEVKLTLGNSDQSLSISKKSKSLGSFENQVSKKKLSIKKARAGKKRLKDYGKVLLAKQLLRALYNNPREKTFKKYFLNKLPSKESPSGLFLAENNKLTSSINAIFEHLNSRLDVVLTAMGGAVSSDHARQLISHGKITVNGHCIKNRGYLLKDGDIIASSEKFLTESNKGDSASLGYADPEGVPKVESASLSTTFQDTSSTIRRSQPTKFDRSRTDQVTFLSLKVASLKPNKIPSYLKLKTPVFANLFVNSDLNYGIYYSKRLNLNEFYPSVSDNTLADRNSQPKVEKMNQTINIGYAGFASAQLNSGDKQTMYSSELAKNAGLGWKNTNVKSIKTLLLDLKFALDLIERDSSDCSLSQKNKGFSENTSNVLKIKQIYSVLYSLVQAYYSRKN